MARTKFTSRPRRTPRRVQYAKVYSKTEAHSDACHASGGHVTGVDNSRGVFYCRGTRRGVSTKPRADMSHLTVQYLRRKLRQAGVKGTSKMKKATLLQKFRHVDATSSLASLGNHLEAASALASLGNVNKK